MDIPRTFRAVIKNQMSSPGFAAPHELNNASKNRLHNKTEKTSAATLIGVVSDNAALYRLPNESENTVVPGEHERHSDSGLDQINSDRQRRNALADSDSNAVERYELIEFKLRQKSRQSTDRQVTENSSRHEDVDRAHGLKRPSRKKMHLF